MLLRQLRLSSATKTTQIFSHGRRRLLATSTASDDDGPSSSSKSKLVRRNLVQLLDMTGQVIARIDASKVDVEAKRRLMNVRQVTDDVFQLYPRPKHPKNEEIAAKRVLVIDENDVNLGEMATTDALHIAGQRRLDLVQVAVQAPNSAPICRITNFGKFVYQSSKKGGGLSSSASASASASASSSSAADVVASPSSSMAQHAKQKEVRVHAYIDEHDLNTKITHARKHLHRGHSVNIVVFFKNQRTFDEELGRLVLTQITDELSEDESLQLAMRQVRLNSSARPTLSVVISRKK